MRKYLVILRSGDKSQLQKWSNYGGERKFDILLSYCGDAKCRFQNFADYYEESSGPRWPSIFQLIEKSKTIFNSYQAYWFPDEHIVADAKSIDRMFVLFSENNLWLAQPAFSNEGHINHKITEMVKHCRLRYTNFVDIVCPIFSNHGLALVKETFNESFSGWGLDYIWCKKLENIKDGIAIIDETPVVYHLPDPEELNQGSGCLRVINPQTELISVLNRNLIPEMPSHLVNRMTWLNELSFLNCVKKSGTEPFEGFRFKNDGTLTVEDFGGYETRNESTIKMIRFAIAKHNIPAFDWNYVYTGDLEPPDTFQGKRLFSYASSSGDYKNVCPDFTFDHWRQTGMEDYEAARVELANMGGRIPETNMMGWRGNIKMHHSRRKLVKLDDKVNFDVENVKWDRTNPDHLVSVNYVSLPDQAKRWRYLVDVEGIGWSGRLKLLFFSKRVIFLQDRPLKEWYFEYLQPWKHYVPVKRDLSDLVCKLELVKNNVQLEKWIIENAFNFAQEHLTRQSAIARWRDLLIL